MACLKASLLKQPLTLATSIQSHYRAPPFKRTLLTCAPHINTFKFHSPRFPLSASRERILINRDPILNNRPFSASSSPDMGSENFPAPEKGKSDKVFTIPTVLTIGRVLSVPILVGTFYVDSWWGTTATTSIFVIAAITDWLDGYIARRMNLGSAFGAFLDPVADKLMVAATLILLCTKPFELPLYGQVPWVLTIPAIAIIGREITMSAVREWAASQSGKLSEAVAVNNLGKWKTATQMTALIILLATRDSSLAESGTLVGSGVVLLYLSAWLSVWSLVVYMRKIWKVLLRL